MSIRALLKDGRRVIVEPDSSPYAAAARMISRRLVRRWVAVRDNDGAISYLPHADIINVSTV